MSEKMQNSSLSFQVLAFTLLGSLLFICTACSDFKRAIGSEKSSPDEFEVVVRPPLSLPPQFGSRPTGKDTDTAAVAASNTLARSTNIFNQREANVVSVDDLFAFNQIEEDIRTKVDEETAGIRFERRLPFQIVFGDLPNVGPVVDKMAEDARIRKNQLQDRAINEGATPAIDQVLGEPVLVK
jgi:hypothetical protein